MSPRPWGAAALVSVAVCASACIAPVVETRAWGSTEGALEKVAIVPFLPWPVQARAGEAIGGPPAQAPVDVTLMMEEALVARGIEVVKAEETSPAVVGEQDGTRPFDGGAVAAETAARFGATSVLVGTVVRFRERTGEALGTMQPASVAFEVTLYDAQGRPMRAAIFDETQRDLSSNVWNAARYPGGGSRWLRADELARWGADAAAEALTAP